MELPLGMLAIGGLHIQSIIRIRIIYLSRKGKTHESPLGGSYKYVSFPTAIAVSASTKKVTVSHLQNLNVFICLFTFTLWTLNIYSAEPLNNKVDALDPSLLFFFSMKTTQPNWSINSRKA